MAMKELSKFDVSSFDTFFKATKAFTFQGAAYYDMQNHFIFLDAQKITSEILFEYCHEMVHAQLGNTLPGLLILTLSEAASMVEKELFSVLRETILAELKNHNPKLYQELFLCGRCFSPAGHQAGERVLPELCKSRAIREELLRHGTAGISLVAFETIARRMLEIMTAWRNIHEGLAVCVSVQAATEPSSASMEFLSSICEQLNSPGVAVDAGEHLERFRSIARSQHRHWSKVYWFSVSRENGS